MTMARPVLVVVSGPGGSGKTTLAHALGQAIGCPVVSRDEIKEGMVLALGGEYEAAPGDSLTGRATAAFFEVVDLFLKAETTIIAEAAFQDWVWRPNLERLAELAHIRIVRCGVDPAIGRERMTSRPARLAHADSAVATDARYYDNFVPISVSAPTIDVDTSESYAPPLDRIVSFVQNE